jgi:hypothetical protein
MCTKRKSDEAERKLERKAEKKIKKFLTSRVENDSI